MKLCQWSLFETMLLFNTLINIFEYSCDYGLTLYYIYSLYSQIN